MKDYNYIYLFLKMEEISLFFDSPIKYMKEFHLKVENEKYELVAQEFNKGINLN
jgi:hypothetical protein